MAIIEQKQVIETLPLAEPSVSNRPPQRLVIPRGFITRAHIASFDENFAIPPSQNEREFPIDLDDSHSKLPPAIHDLVHFLIDPRNGHERFLDQAPNMGVLRRNDRLTPYRTDPLHEESERFSGRIAVTNLGGASRLQALHLPSLQIVQSEFMADGTTEVMDADTFYALTTPNMVSRGLHLVLGRRQPDYIPAPPPEIPA